MQPQSEHSNSKPKTKSSSTNQQQQPQQKQQEEELPATAPAPTGQEPRRHSVKVIKSKRPLCHFVFYLDICDHQLTKKIEEQIKALCGRLEFFLTPSVTHFITDKTVLPPTKGNNNNTLSSRPGTPQTPATPGTPHTPYTTLEPYDGRNNNGSGSTTTPAGSKRTRQSRADAILNRARRQSTNANVTATITELGAPFNKATTSAIKIEATTQPYKVWQTDYALRFFKRVQQDLEQYLKSSQERKLSCKSNPVEPITFKGSFLKIESLKKSYRPYYQLFKKPTEWPKIELSQEDGAFRFSPKKNHGDLDRHKKKMTRKSRSRSSQRQPAPLPPAVQALKRGDGARTSTGARHSNNGGCKQPKESSDKQCGVCEICKIEYDTLTIHLKTKDHEYFAKNNQNYLALDTLIHATANVNKFLEENKKVDIKPHLEEMEVEEEHSMSESSPGDSFDGPKHSILHREAKRSSSIVHKTPSPTLREKSKRITKGKHSSEKFQNTVKQLSKTPKTPPKSVSPQKPSSSILELQRSEAAATNATSVITPMPRRKASAASLLSPPIRAMLPPSSLYKVVEPPPEVGTPTRTLRESGDTAVGSPSLIVKFKKVRAAELARLNGEAENFMFPKRRTSSELPTDVDRQTTSETALLSASSTSIDSSSDPMDVDPRHTDASSQELNSSLPLAAVGKKAYAIAKRKQGEVPKQSFPNAPIQPEVELKRARKSSLEAKLISAPVTITAAVLTASSSIASSMSITSNVGVPEATRKSSRTATAIVTAATTSSRLLRAAVEAAKNNNRRVATNRVKESPPRVRKCLRTYTKQQLGVAEADETTEAIETTTETATATVSTSTMMTRRRVSTSVVKLEDRMGDAPYTTSSNAKGGKFIDNQCDVEFDESLDDEEDDDDDDNDDDDDDDEDYTVKSRKYKKPRRSQAVDSLISQPKRISARQQGKKTQQLKNSNKMTEGEKDSGPAAGKSGSTRSRSRRGSAQNFQKTVPQMFDYTKSERLHKLRYAFERLPASDLWYRVFTRQDACEERYYEHFGSTNYRKLPYELGPIPLQSTLNGICCALCQNAVDKPKQEELVDSVVVKQERECLEESKSENVNGMNSSIVAQATQTTDSISSLSYKHKHKKLHLLQRYRQEQQELLQKEQIEQKPTHADISTSATTTTTTTTSTTARSKCDSETEAPERERERERAGSIHSTASSYASSNATSSTKKYQNKHLSKVAFLNLELPPRKSPREHASTLALVSCIIKQRQDSQSKTNSETDEPPTTPTPFIKEEATTVPLGNSSISIKPTVEVPIISSPRTRSTATTPIEEMRFATEISENVKRIRRGQNKYDHSPPIVLSPTRNPRGRPPKTIGRPRKAPSHQSPSPKMMKCRRRSNATMSYATPSKPQNYNGAATQSGSQTAVRKTGSKRGVLEFEMDAAALRTLDQATKYKNVRQLEWEIDKFLEMSNSQYNMIKDMGPAPVATSLQIESHADSQPVQRINSCMGGWQASITGEKTGKSTVTTMETNTPPPTDCFSSDFDLCDLFMSMHNGNNSDDEQPYVKSKSFNLYSSVALNNYFRKRKNLKSNRTGWPKVQKKKTSVRQQQLLRQKIRFLQGFDEMHKAVVKEEPMEIDDEDTKEQTRESGVITPPDSELGENGHVDKTIDNDEDGEAADTELDAAESIPEEDDVETMADSIEDEHDVAEADADADEEEDEEEEEEDYEEEDATFEGDDEDECENRSKRIGRISGEPSPTDKLNNSLGTIANIGASSTPSAHLLRGLRRTPQLNGSLGSCMSPSEKAGDNSDIFTVSSDGLDTDLDMSNSHTQFKGDDEHHEHCPHHTPKRKFDLSKYTSKNSTVSSCAAEAATAAVKSLAIAQFLNKEVRVTCRRLRAPFRRFRYRR